MRKIWGQRKERDKRKSFMLMYSSNEQQEHEKHNGGHGESDGVDDQSTLANSTIGSIPESSTESDYTVGTRNSVRSVSTLAKNDYDQNTVKNAWLNATIGASSVQDMSENMLRVYRAELKGSHMYLYKPTVLNARRFQLTDATESADKQSDIFNHNNESGVLDQSVVQEDSPDEVPQLTYYRIDMAHPELKYDFERRLFLPDSSIEALVHFLLFQTHSSYNISIDQLIETLPLFPDFGVVVRLVLSFLLNLFDSKLQGEFNELIITDRILRLLSNVQENFQGFLVRCEIHPIILKIIEVLSNNLKHDENVRKIQAFKTSLVGRQNSIIELVTYDLPSENPFHDLNSNVFINDINVIDFSRTINFIDLNFFKNWNSNIDKSLLLYSSLKDNNSQDFFYKKNPLIFDNDHHIHYLSRLLVNHLFIENISGKNNNFLERKARLLEKWIDVGCFLEKSGNMSSWLGIASIILSQPILRLTRIWYLVSPDYIRLLKNDWSPVLFELDRRFLVNGSINSDQISKTSDSLNLKFDDFTSRDSYHIMAPRGLGKIYPKENVIPYFGDLIMNNHSTDIHELESIWKRINYSFNRWNEYLSSLTNYDEIIKYNDDVLRRYENMGFIFSNESLNQVLYLGVNSDDTKPLPAKYHDSSSSNINTNLRKKLLKLIEINCDSTNLEKIMKLSLLMEPELPESYLKVSTESQSTNSEGLNTTISSISIHSNDSLSSLNATNDSNISLPSQQHSLGDSRASRIPTFNNNYFKIALAKYDDLLLQNIPTENKAKFLSLDSSIIKHNFVIDDQLTLRVDDFITDLESSFINSSTLQGLDDDDDDEMPGLGIDVDDILNSDKFNNIDIHDKLEPSAVQNEEAHSHKKHSKNYSLISSDSSKFSQQNGYIPKYASIDRLIDLLLIDAKYFNENISINLSEYRFVFLLNYNSFITTKELLDKLSHRFINSSNAIISIMKKLYLIKNGNVDIQLQSEFPNWNLDTSVNISELGNIDYEALLEIQTNILKVLIVLINNFYSNFINDLINKKIFIKLLKLFSNEILQWYNSNKIDSHLEKPFENLVNYYKKLKRLFIKKTYRPIEMLKFDEYLIKEFRFSNSLHDVPINRNLPGHKNLNKVEKFLHKFNKLLTTFYKLIKTEDWIKIYKILENQFEKNSLLGFNLQKTSISDDSLIISNIFNFFESLSDLQEKQLILKQFPLVFRKLFKLYFKFRSYLLIQLTDLNITVDERLDRMKTLLLMLKISKLKMSDNQFVFEGDQDNIPSCIETAITNVIYLPESRLFAGLWMKASMSLNENLTNPAFEDINLLLPSNINENSFAINEPLLPCFGWIIENLIEANKCPSFHKQIINFNKRYLIYKIIKELCVEDIDGQESNGFNCHENREFDFLLKLDESLVNRQKIKDFIVGQDKERSRLFRSVLHDQHKILALDNKKKHLGDGSGSIASNTNPTSSMHTLSKKSSSSSLRRQSLSYKSNSSSRFKISGIFGKTRPFSLNASSTSERIISSNELPSPESYTDPKQKPYLIIPLKGKKIFPVYSLPFAFKIDSDSPNEDSFFQAPNENELNDWLVKLNYANRHWFYSKNLNLKANHTCSTFGIPIEVVCNRDQSSVPKFLMVIFEEIENEGLKDIGIYRISSSVSELNHVKSIIDKTGTISFNDRAYDPHTLASCVKSYFRELPDALLIDLVIESFFFLEKENPERVDNTNVIENYAQILKNLPSTNYQTLKLLLKHLQKVSHFSEHNKMTASNLATVIGPALTEASNLDCLINNFGFMNSILEKLITNYDYVFQDGS